MSSCRYLYATKHSVQGVAASRQILNQVEGFQEELGKEFLFLFKIDSKDSFLDLPSNTKVEAITTTSNLFFLLKIIFYFLVSPKIKMIYTRDLIVVFAAILTFKKVVYESHHKASKAARIFIFCFNRFFSIVAISEGLKDFLVNKVKVRKNNILVLHDAVDWDSFQKKIPKREKIRESLNFLPDKVYASYTGTVGNGRGMEHFHEAVLLNPDIDFFIAGDDGSKYKALLRVKVPTNLYFKGFLQYEEVMNLQIASDLLINSIDETHPNINVCSQLKLFEYMATGNLVISPDIGSLGEVVSPNKALIYNQKNKKDSLASILKEASSNIKSFSELTSQAKAFTEHNTWKNRAEKIVSSFK